MKRWMVMLFVGLALVGSVAVGFHLLRRKAELKAGAEEYWRNAGAVQALEAKQRDRRQAEMAKEDAEYLAKMKKYGEELEESMKRILNQQEFAAYKEKKETDERQRKAARLQEDQLKELQEINEKLGK